VKAQIQLSIKGLAKYMTAGPARQRKILEDFKFDTEGKAQAAYYREARSIIKRFHREQLPASILETEAAALAAGAQNTSVPQIATRLKNNARAVKSYRDFFGHREYVILPDLQFALAFGGVQVTVNPDLHVRDCGTEKFLKLEFSSDEPDKAVVKIICQALLEAVNQSEDHNVTPSQLLYVDVPRCNLHNGAKIGAMTQRNIEAACQNIAAIWNTLSKGEEHEA
jgi:hypothetical protein